MASREIVLNCLLYGNEPEHPQLQDAIKAEKSVDLAHIDANNLDLWKVSIPFDDSQYTTRVKEYAFENENRARSLRTLSSLFDDPLDEHLHVLVRGHDGSTINPRSSSSSNYRHQALMDEAKATWKAWWGKPLDFKLKTMQLPIAVNQDDMDIDDTLTSSVSVQYLDTKNAMIKAPDSILIREEYDLALENLKRESIISGGVAILGNPGIGKTCFLWYALRCRLRDKLPTLFTMDSDPSIYFSANGASDEATSAARREEKIWSLFDLGAALHAPDAMLWTNVFGVQTTSPQETRYKGWLKLAEGQTWTMNPWSWHEIVMGLGLQPNLAVIDRFDHDLLASAFAKYGPIPRNVYSAYRRDGHNETYDQTLNREIENITPDVLKRLVNSAPVNALIPVSHMMISVQRAPDTNLPYGAVLSQFVLGLLMHASSFKTLDSVARGWCFKAYCHAMLTKAPDDDVSHSIPTLATSGKNTGTHVVDTHGQSPDYARMYRDTVIYESVGDFATLPASDGKYYIPMASNNPGFDSFTIIGTEAWIFQMTVSESHRIDTPKQKGLELLKKILPLHLSWRYILVVPKSTSGPSLTNVPREWEGAVKSFHVMRIDMKV
ncbi:hypothetical protein FIBSPDRAFT_925558 [Athelia psychrophila]|uniref:Crinkler effector protein N-terminal domain-containing protein n=1 Tax=Athelia psychrophila TaxID=1759441 RepID=A0A166UI43_9AGAM|nr:hypothetical protein FIBSPDRAFT_925558 [Fibularhizoctonia sp. CBS 109695]